VRGLVSGRSQERLDRVRRLREGGAVKRARLIIAASESCADMLYATKFRAPDAFVFVEVQGKTAVLLSDLEVDRGRREARVDEVVSLSEFEKSLQGKKKRKPSFARTVAAFLKSRGAKRVTVPGDFPLVLARALKKEDIKLRPAEGHFWPEREFKTDEEIRVLTRALRVAEAGLARGIEVLKASTIRKDGKLVWSRQVLTSEILRQEMEIAVVRAGGEARGDTIVAGGEQACDPHDRGSGPLYGNQLIILDIFPRDARSGYFGDITRTVVRGRASDAQRRLWETCLEGQKQVLAKITPGAFGGTIHEELKNFFAESGYPTEIRDGRWQGFFHGTGHGLGLEIHENPRFGAVHFQPGQVFTVEPGLYIPGIGGVRHEDVVVITGDGCKLLTTHPKPLEI
jgi:Xaa-Pro aminopeptidase